jgi:maltokinase
VTSTPATDGRHPSETFDGNGAVGSGGATTSGGKGRAFDIDALLGKADDWLVAPLRAWIPQQRWFASKGRVMTSLEVVEATPVVVGDPAAAHVLVEVRFAEGAPERYQIVLGLRRTPLPRLDHVHIADTTDADGRIVAYSGLWDGELASALLDLIGSGTQRGTLRFTPETGTALTSALQSRVMDGEQSNTSVVYGEDYILKLFRRVSTGLNPDLELHRALRKVECQYVAEVYGAIEGESGGEPVTYGMLQRFASNSANGWAMATASVRDLLAEQDLRADEVGGDFAGESHRLGEAVAAVHACLAAALGSSELSRAGIQALSASMRARLDGALVAVPQLAHYESALREAFSAVADAPGPLAVQRVHGDLHLGQVLRIPTGWLLIDFEGEPVKPMDERRAPDLALRDVAGMLRSYDYAAHHLLLDYVAEEQATYRATEWSTRNRSAFCDGYAAVAGQDPRDSAALLRAYELDKAVYEAVYEARNRPAWQAIPLASVERLLS